FAQTLQVWVYTALPKLGATYVVQLEDFPDDLIIIHIFYLLQTRVINFVQKDIGQMFPKWEFDIEDTPAENIIKLIFVVKEDNPRPRKKAHKEAPAEASEESAAEASEEAAAEARDIKTMFKDIADAMREGFGTCLKEFKYLSETVEAVEKKVGITTKRKGTSSQNTTSPPKPTLEPGLHLLCFLYCMDFIYSESVNGTNAGRKSLAEDKGPDVPAAVPADASSSKDKAPESSLQSLYTANSTARVIIPNKKLYPGYNPFAPIDKKKLKELADWLKTCPHYRTPLDKKPLFCYDLDDLLIIFYHIDAWINVLRKRYDANPQHFRSERMCFLVHLFAQQWRFNFKDFKDSEPDQNGLGRRLPGGAWNYYAGTIPSFCQSNKIAMWTSIPKRHIVVFGAFSLHAGDCGVYTLKYIECHALGIEFSKIDFAKANGKTMRDKMAVDIFQELPDAHEFENKDNDANLGAYEG
ncbi:unnamed protein product, partial [Brassica oleracea]